MPENLQLQFLSFCLGAKSGSFGLATWHDFHPSQRTNTPFKRLAVVGSLGWILIGDGWEGNEKRKVCAVCVCVFVGGVCSEKFHQ